MIKVLMPYSISLHTGGVAGSIPASPTQREGTTSDRPPAAVFCCAPLPTLRKGTTRSTRAQAARRENDRPRV